MYGPPDAAMVRSELRLIFHVVSDGKRSVERTRLADVVGSGGDGDGEGDLGGGDGDGGGLGGEGTVERLKMTFVLEVNEGSPWW